MSFHVLVIPEDFRQDQYVLKPIITRMMKAADTNRRERIRRLEQRAAARFAGTDRLFVGENAWQELEVWLLAGIQDLPAEWSWKALRAERDAKEAYFDPYVDRRGLRSAPYQGRALLAEEAARRYDRIRQLCPEDVGALHDGLRARLHP